MSTKPIVLLLKAHVNDMELWLAGHAAVDREPASKVS